MKLDSSFVSTAGLKRLETTPAIPFTLTKIPRYFTFPRRRRRAESTREALDEPPLTPRPLKSLFSSESLLRGTRSPFIPAALPAKSVGIFPPTRTRLAGPPPPHNVHPSALTRRGDRGQDLGCGGAPQSRAESCLGPGMEVPPLTL